MRLKNVMVRNSIIWSLILIIAELALFLCEYIFFDLPFYEMCMAGIICFVCVICIGIGNYIATVKTFTKLNKKIAEVEIDVELDNNIKISNIDIAEIDFLFEKILNVANDDKRIIINIYKFAQFFGIDIGLFEIDLDKKILTTAINLASILKIEEYDEIGNGLIRTKKYSKIEAEVTKNEEKCTFVYCTDMEKGRRWIDVFKKKKGNMIYGMMIDVTNQILEKKLYNYDDGLDSFTGLYSYDDFLIKIKEMLLEPINYCSFMTLELNMLKSINDTYGYKVGDEYIRKFASILTESSMRSIFGKKSGYEFLVFSGGYYSMEEIYSRTKEWKDALEKSEFVAPDGKKYRFKVTSGYCIYPEHANTIEKMIKYSAFALYESKKIYGGVLHEFSLESFNSDEFFKRKINSFYDIIEKNNVWYEFQPIVNLTDGNVYGYEALMRTSNNNFLSPLEILEIAKSENVGYLVEKMTVFNCAEILKKNKNIFKNKKLFYNTIAESSLTSKDLLHLLEEYSSIEHILIPEIDEVENEGLLYSKCAQLAKGNNKKALDKYSAKFKDYKKILVMGVNYIKIDRSIISDISVKKEQQAMVYNIVKTAKANNIITIAVGVETTKELKTLIDMGVDFAQGFYICVPKRDFVNEIRNDVKNEIMEFNRH